MTQLIILLTVILSMCGEAKKDPNQKQGTRLDHGVIN